MLTLGSSFSLTRRWIVEKVGIHFSKLGIVNSKGSNLMEFLRLNPSGAEARREKGRAKSTRRLIEFSPRWSGGGGRRQREAEGASNQKAAARDSRGTLWHSLLKS